VVVHAFNPNYWEAEFEVSLGYTMRLCQKKKKKKVGRKEVGREGGMNR
jgi:hypothetical protein